MGRRQFDDPEHLDLSEFHFDITPDVWSDPPKEKPAAPEYSFFGDEEEKKKPVPSRKKKKRPAIAVAAVLLGVMLTVFTFREEPQSVYVPTVETQQVSVPTEAQQVSTPTEPLPIPQILPAETVAIPTEKPTEPYPPQPPRQENRSLYYFRSLLSAEDQADYDNIVRAARNFETKVTNIRTKSIQQLCRIHQSVWRDHPELFWLDSNAGQVSYSPTEILSLELKYTMPPSEGERQQKQLEAKIAPLLDSLRSCSEYDKLLGVYEYIINQSVYELNDTSPSAAVILLSGRGRCGDYAAATSYLLNKLGMQSLFVTGEAGGELHAWNIVRVNGRYYQVDTTWGDPIYEDGIQRITYAYFCQTTDEISVDHQADGEFPWPACTDPTLGYYRVTGRFVDSYDEQLLARWLSECRPDQIDVSFQCATPTLANQYLTQLFSNNRISKVLSDAFPNKAVTVICNTDSDNRTMHISNFNQ